MSFNCVCPPSYEYAISRSPFREPSPSVKFCFVAYRWIQCSFCLGSICLPFFLCPSCGSISSSLTCYPCLDHKYSK